MNYKTQPLSDIGLRSRQVAIDIPSPIPLNQHRVFLQQYISQSLHEQLQKQIGQLKERIQVSNRILCQSRRQSKSPKKIVSSDAIIINYIKKGIKPKKDLQTHKKIYQDSIQNQYKQGISQLPNCTFSRQKQKFQTDRCTNKNKKQQFRLQNFYQNVQPHKQSNNIPSYYTAKSPQRIDKKSNTAQSCQRCYLKHKFTNKKQNKLYYTINSNQKKQTSLRKQLTKSQQQLRKLHSSTIYTNKSRINKNTNRTPKPMPINIRLNHISGDSVRHVKQRYQIELSQIPEPSATIMPREQTQDCHQDWKQLKAKVQRYQFVRKYLSEGDIYSIYEFLDKNKISHQKWPLFVVDEAYKKMQVSKHK